MHTAKLKQLTLLKSTSILQLSNGLIDEVGSNYIFLLLEFQSLNGNFQRTHLWKFIN